MIPTKSEKYDIYDSKQYSDISYSKNKSISGLKKENSFLVVPWLQEHNRNFFKSLNNECNTDSHNKSSNQKSNEATFTTKAVTMTKYSTNNNNLWVQSRVWEPTHLNICSLQFHNSS